MDVSDDDDMQALWQSVSGPTSRLPQMSEQAKAEFMISDIKKNQSARDHIVLTLIALIAFLPGLSSLPVIDRDEARYAQATVQMIESRDYIDIRFQDQARHKKPAGAYWAQVGALGLSGQIDDVRRGERAIWAHRLPSVLGALIAVLATYWTGTALFGRREAFAGAALLAVSVSLVFEAHIAKTDALLAGACAVALYGLTTRRAWPTWLALAVGLLLKGPVIIGVAGLALLTDGLLRRSWDRIRPIFKPLPILSALVISLPWFIAIGLITDGAFFAEALGRDFGGKIATTQETHGGPPGYYVLTGLIMFWPGIVAVPLGVIYTWRNRFEPAVIWLMSWLVPMWIILELVPTKLPHYTLPLYPALALLAGAALVTLTPARRAKIAGMLLMGFTGIILSGTLAVTLMPFDGSELRLVRPAIALTVLCGIVLTLMWISAKASGQDRDIIRISGLGALFSAIAFGLILSNSSLFDLTPRVMSNVDPNTRIVSPDYREPSLVFQAGTKTALSRHALRPGDALILSHYSNPPDCAVPAGSVFGTHYVKGDNMMLSIYNTDACNAQMIAAWSASASTQ